MREFISQDWELCEWERGGEMTEMKAYMVHHFPQDLRRIPSERKTLGIVVFY